MSHYILTPAHDKNATKRITAVYVAANVTPPLTFLPALRKHMNTQPDARTVAATLAAEAYRSDPDADPAEWYADAVEQVARAQASDVLRSMLTGTLDAEERASGTRQAERALADLNAYATRLCKTLTAAAKALPAGPLALDSEANLAADTGKHLTTARATLTALAAVQSITDTASRHVGTLGYYAHAMTVVDPGTPEVERTNGLGSTVNESKLGNTRALRKFATDMKADPDLALVDVARGAYSGLSIAPVASLADVSDRAERAGKAFTIKTASEAEQRHLIAMR